MKSVWKDLVKWEFLAVVLMSLGYLFQIDLINVDRRVAAAVVGISCTLVALVLAHSQIHYFAVATASYVAVAAAVSGDIVLETAIAIFAIVLIGVYAFLIHLRYKIESWKVAISLLLEAAAVYTVIKFGHLVLG